MVVLISHREYEILTMLASGKSLKQVAMELKLGMKTVDTHRASLSRKIGTHSVIEMLAMCLRGGVLELTDLPECESEIVIRAGLSSRFSGKRQTMIKQLEDR